MERENRNEKYGRQSEFVSRTIGFATRYETTGQSDPTLVRIYGTDRTPAVLFHNRVSDNVLAYYVDENDRLKPARRSNSEPSVCRMFDGGLPRFPGAVNTFVIAVVAVLRSRT